MGMTDRQLLWRVELPLSVPEIVAGLRIATVSTVAIATLAVFAGGGGLGEQLVGSNLTFKTNVLVVAVLAIGMAIVFDLLLLLAAAAAYALAATGRSGNRPRVRLPPARSLEHGMIELPLAFLGPVGDALELIFNGVESPLARGEVGGLSEVWEFTVTHIELSAAALAAGLLVGAPARRHARPPGPEGRCLRSRQGTRGAPSRSWC